MGLDPLTLSRPERISVRFRRKTGETDRISPRLRELRYEKVFFMLMLVDVDLS